jgi:hypothetical protein
MQQKKLLSLCVFYASTFLALNIGIGSFDILWSAGPNWSIGKQKTSLLTDPARQNSQNAPTKQNNLLQQGANALRGTIQSNAQNAPTKQNNLLQQGANALRSGAQTNAQVPSSPTTPEKFVPTQGSDALQNSPQSGIQNPLPAQVLSSTQNSNSPQQETNVVTGSPLTNAQVPSSPITPENFVPTQGSSNGSEPIANPSGSKEPSVNLNVPTQNKQ